MEVLQWELARKAYGAQSHLDPERKFQSLLDFGEVFRGASYYRIG